MDINQLLSGLLGGLAQSDTAVKTEQGRSAETTAGISGAAANMEGFAGDAIAKSMLASQQAAEIERQKAAAGEQAQIVAGLNPDDLNNEYVRTMAELTATRDQRNAELAKYRSLTETSFLDNPVGYIFNQLELPQVVQRHNNLATQQDALTSDLATRTTLMYQNKTQVTANVADATKEMRLQEAAANEAVAKANLEKMRMENFGKISTARMNELALQDKLIQNASTRYSAGMQKAQFDAMQAERAEARAERKLRMDEAAKDKAEKDAQDGALAIGLARVSGALGYPVPVTLNDFKKMPASKAKQALYNAAIEGTFGDDLAGAIGFVKTGNGARMQQSDPAFVSGVRAIDTAVGSYQSAVASKLENAKMKPEDARAEGAAMYTRDVVAAAHDPKAAAPLNDPKWDTTFNPYRSQDATLVALVKSGQMPALANNSFVKVMDTVAATMPPGTPEFRGEDRTAAIKALAELVSARKITVQQAAADLVTYTKTAAEYNQSTLKLASLNMPVQTNSFVKIPGYSFTSQAKVGDTMNIASAENLLTSLATDRTAGKFAGPGGFWR
jgi:hypothetical protein